MPSLPPLPAPPSTGRKYTVRFLPVEAPTFEDFGFVAGDNGGVVVGSGIPPRLLNAGVEPGSRLLEIGGDNVTNYTREQIHQMFTSYRLTNFEFERPQPPSLPQPQPVPD